MRDETMNADIITILQRRKAWLDAMHPGRRDVDALVLIRDDIWALVAAIHSYQTDATATPPDALLRGIDLQAMLERHSINRLAADPVKRCVYDAQRWPCDAYQMLATIVRLDARVKTLEARPVSHE